MPGDVSLTRTLLVISGIINAVFGAGWIVYTLFLGLFTCGIGLILYIPWLVFLIMGIMNAAKGECKPMPLIGSFGEKFNMVK